MEVDKREKVLKDLDTLNEENVDSYNVNTDINTDIKADIHSNLKADDNSFKIFKGAYILVAGLATIYGISKI